VDGWLHRHMPRVRRWQYDDNSGERSINLFHVHVFIETRPFSFAPREGYEYFPPHVVPAPVDDAALTSPAEPQLPIETQTAVTPLAVCEVTTVVSI
jgi:hypothetical protein